MTEPAQGGPRQIPTAQLTTKEIVARARLSVKARAVLRPDLSPTACVAMLLRQELYFDAIPFLAHAMLRRRAVWWGCLSVRQVHQQPMSPAEENALRAAVGWVVSPTEANRRAAEPTARAASLESPAGCLAWAAFWSGGSVSPPPLPAVATRPPATGQAVSAAILKAACRGKPETHSPEQRRLLALGIDVVLGKIPWQ